MNRKDESLDLMISIENGTKGGTTLLASFAITAIDRTGNESEFIEHKIGGVN